MNRLLVVLVVVLGFAGCGSETAPGEGGGDDVLDGKTFVSSGVEGRALVAGTHIRLVFREGTIGANAGCNHLSGEFRIDRDVLRVGQIGGTEMGCDPERHAQDEWLSGFLLSAPTFVVDGDTLTLTSGDATIMLSDREVAEPDLSLTGTRWVVDTIIEGDAASSVPQAAEAWLIVAADGAVTGSDGCNEFSGTATVSAARITFAATRSTDRACTADVQRLVDMVGVLVNTEAVYEIESNRLTLTASDGRGASFTSPAGGN